MEFAGGNLIYLSKLKKDKIQKIKEDKIYQCLKKYNQKEENKLSAISNTSEDTFRYVNSKDFNIDLVSSNPLPLNNSNLNNVFKIPVDTNVCVIRFNILKNESEQKPSKLYKCEKCKAYLNKYSILKISSENNIYEWKCEFCFNINKIFIEEENIPRYESIEKCIQPTIENDLNIDDDSSLIFCFDISGSMCQSYKIGKELKEKFNKIIGYKSSNKSIIQNVEYKNDIDFTNFDFNQNR